MEVCKRLPEMHITRPYDVVLLAPSGKVRVELSSLSIIKSCQLPRFSLECI